MDDSDMDITFLDNPLVLSTLFYPRTARPGTHPDPNVHDGRIPVADGVVLGYRLYPHTKSSAPVILFFHGNGEVASDYDMFARDYHRAGASLLVVDYRGYGWSTGKPLVSALLADVEPVIAALPGVLDVVDLAGAPLYVMGRSLGSAPAIHAAHTHPDRFKGMIIESGFARATRLLARLGLPSVLTDRLPDPVANDKKMAGITLPLLVIHGERDNLIPVENGQALYDASPAAIKRILRVPGAGHNDLLMIGIETYFKALGQFIDDTLTDSVPPQEGQES
ncbi:MAG: alpha/beta fold hydrolase [Anaerolineae bacterium]|nr:alpha/beta fold hydrolase [Anaerolineae bacterium]